MEGIDLTSRKKYIYNQTTKYLNYRNNYKFFKRIKEFSNYRTRSLEKKRVIPQKTLSNARSLEQTKEFPVRILPKESD